jgi:hypothetical protein
LLAGMGWSMELLLRRNSTLLLSALLNASKHGKKPFAAISRTLRTSKRKAPPEPGILLLQRSATIREKLFEREPRILSFDAKRRGKKSEKTLSSLLLDPAHLSPALQQKLVKVMRLERGEFQTLTFKFRMAENRRRLEALARDARAVFDEDERWNSLVEKARLTPRKVHSKLTARTKLSGRFHRDPTPIAVLTGQDSDNRNFVTQRFREPGNPLILVLTHVCQIGIDLHPFCWDILHYSPAWTPHEGEQKTGRIDRPRLPATKAQLAIGDPRKRHEIRVHHLLWPFTYDERILSRLNVRGHYAERLLGSKGHHDAPDDQARRLRDFRPLELESKS